MAKRNNNLKAVHNKLRGKSNRKTNPTVTIKEKIRQILLQTAKRGETIFYSEVRTKANLFMDVPGPGYFPSAYELRNYKGSDKFAFFSSELKKVHGYWTNTAS